MYHSLVIHHELEAALKKVSKLLDKAWKKRTDWRRAVELCELVMEGELRKIAGEMIGRLMDSGCEGVAINKERAGQLVARNEEGDGEGNE